MSLYVPRRDFLKGLGASAGVAGCGSSPLAPAPGIDHIVLCMMENRSFDHVLGALSLEEGRADVDGLLATMSNPHPDGSLVYPFRAIDHCLEDPDHGWNGSRRQFAGGTNQGFVEVHAQRAGSANAHKVMGYYPRTGQPISFAMSDAYTTMQRWFCSVMGPTWPNRLYSHGAQSEGMSSNDLPSGTFFTMRTIWHQLDEAGVDWGYYYSDGPFILLFDGLFDRDEVREIDDFWADCAAGTLPSVCMVEPSFLTNDDHPPHHPMLGQLFLASVHNAIATSPLWDRTLLIIDYDEHGGFFDHVPPPLTADDRASEGFDQLGFRIPALAIGPYARRGFVDDTQYDHASALATIQRRFGLGHLTARDEAANDLSAVVDDARIAMGAPLPPAELPIIELSADEIMAECAMQETSGPLPGQPELFALADAVDHPKWRHTRGRLRTLVERQLEVGEALGACVVK